jgi:hypothetical protein
MNIPGDLKQITEALMDKINPIGHLKNLDYPRRAGTDGERKASAYINQILEGCGFQPALQDFHFSKPKSLPRVIPLLVITVWMILSLVNIRYWDSDLVISLIVLTLPLGLILAVLNFKPMMKYLSSRRSKRISKVQTQIKEGTLSLEEVITSQNVIAEEGPEDGKTEVLFTAHIDSISSTIPIQLTKPMMILGGIGVIIYSTLYLVNTITRSAYGLDFLGLYFPYFAIFGIIVLAALAVIFISRLFRGNDSHGIIDDGTGTAILLELAEFLKAEDYPGTKFTFGFFGAEESGLIGSTYYYLNRRVDNTKLHVISVDMIGEKPPLAYVKGIYPINQLKMDPTFNQTITAVAEALGIKIKGKTFLYPGSDFAPFMIEGGCKANWLINQSKWIHSKNDTMGNLNQGLVIDTLKLLVGYLLVIRGTKE